MNKWPITVPTGRRVIADVETDGLPAGPGVEPENVMTKVHSLTVDDIDTGEHWSWGPISKEDFEAQVAKCQDADTKRDLLKGNYMGTLDEGMKFVKDECGTIIGHNFLLFDAIEAIDVFYPWVDIKSKLILDTLIFCKMVWPADALIGPDMKRWKLGKMPAKYLKRQSLGAWGYRLGNYKGEYDGGWKVWNLAMHAYMVQDGKVNLDLWRLIEKRIGWNNEWTPECGVYQWPGLPFWIEHEVALILHEQEKVGVSFDEEKAQALIGELKNLQGELADKLRDIFGAWWSPASNVITPKKDRVVKLKGFPDVTEPRFGAKGQPLKPYIGPPKEQYFAGAPYQKIEYTTFNPNSRRHLADRLQRVFGWVPTMFTPTGEAMVDEGSIKNIPDSVIDATTRQIIMDYFVVTKTLGMVDGGNKSWMTFLVNGRIHGRIDPLGTVTHRGAHFNPNLGQVMSVKVDEVKDKLGKIIQKIAIAGLAGGFGLEARSLFRATPGWELTGTDCSSLEFIWLGHDLWDYDGGDFSKRACDPDADLHEENSKLTGLSRRDTKTCGYAYIFGAGAPNIGEQVGLTPEDDIKELANSSAVVSRLRWQKRTFKDYKEPDEHARALIGKGYVVIGKFEDAITGIKDLKKALTEFAKEHGYIIAIDGRKLMIRKPHAALNTRLQGNGAVTCKLWMILMHQKLKAAGLKPRIDYNQVLWIHDELQKEHRPGLGEMFARLSDEAVKETGVMLGLRGELRTETKTGLNWADTH